MDILSSSVLLNDVPKRKKSNWRQRFSRQTDCLDIAENWGNILIDIRWILQLNLPEEKRETSMFVKRESRGQIYIT